MQVTSICCFCACLYSLSLTVRKGSVEVHAEIICTACIGLTNVAEIVQVSSEQFMLDNYSIKDLYRSCTTSGVQ